MSRAMVTLLIGIILLCIIGGALFISLENERMKEEQYHKTHCYFPGTDIELKDYSEGTMRVHYNVSHDCLQELHYLTWNPENRTFGDYMVQAVETIQVLVIP